jgi:HPt (histidine-containing phosphotransfer) domain-containing protein
MIDWGRIDDLRSEIGPEDFDEVVSLFLSEADEVVARLQQAAGRAVAEAALRDDLHFLKGAALNLGFRDLAELCQTGERQPTPPGPQDLERIAESYHASRRAFLAGDGAAAA